MPTIITPVQVSESIEDVSKETRKTTDEDKIVQLESTNSNSQTVPLQHTEESDDFAEDSLMICEDNFVSKNYEADNSSRFVFYIYIV